MEEYGWTPHGGHVSLSCQEFIEIKNTLFFFSLLESSVRTVLSIRQYSLSERICFLIL